MNTRFLWLLVMPGFLSLTGGRLWALAPPRVSDEALARYPVIVVAKWEKSPFKAHNREETRDGEQVITKSEAFTYLKIERVIAGDLKPGTHKLMVGWGIVWEKDGAWVQSGTSSEIWGDAGPLTGPNIWFLQKEKSWDEKDRTEYLSISNFREIQPPVLEGYFRALGSAHPETEVSKLLPVSGPAVLRRMLRYMEGDLWPWPFDNEFEEKDQKIKKGTVLRGQSAAVAAIIERKELKEVRDLAVAVYADMEGPRGLPYLRKLLGDQNPDVRTTAAALLVRHKDSGSLPGIVGAINGNENGTLACRIIEAMSAWGEVQLVPALAAYLESDDLAWQYGDDMGIPALKAREALHRMTGHWFPFDVRASLAAWKETGKFADIALRQQLLDAIVPGAPSPLKAEVTGDGGTNAICRITNKSNQSVALTRLPAHCGESWPAGSGSSFASREKPKGNEDFVLLKPGEVTECPLVFDESFLLADPSSRTVKIEYRSCGRDWGMHAWIGSLTAEFGTGWKEKRELKNSQEKWPNGNLKVKGRTMNGRKYGEWHFFNEEGDRIRTVDYSRGVTSECNPNHPDNKGAGKPSAGK